MLLVLEKGGKDEEEHDQMMMEMKRWELKEILWGQKCNHLAEKAAVVVALILVLSAILMIYLSFHVVFMRTP